ncbi:hypothetical protein AVL59_32205 [Streptomyces griseochromogenes]|uniref:Uncharacterized protein n=1 Tax=Streptomyces griseochromogenes TaxID=68214 RepID=A0A1B1B438_9ACTN|nr:hypothetical protein AVL59_32205 [Streptomyces griseochromogenes]
MRQLTLVVTCTDRKAAVPETELQARQLPAGPVTERAALWSERINSAAHTHSLAELYRGDHWTQARRLREAAAQAGFKADVWVASAGLGLQPVSASAPSYAATFSTRHADSVATTAEDGALWWSQLQERTGRATLQELGKASPVLLVLSEIYAKAMEAELRALADVASEALLFGGGEQIAGIQRVPADAGLRRTLGGTLTSLNVRMAATWFQHCQDGQLTSTATSDSWNKWAASESRPEQHNRRPMTDEQVISFIRKETLSHPGISRTRLLRLLRDSGQACEQSRFANLYVKTMG